MGVRNSGPCVASLAHNRAMLYLRLLGEVALLSPQGVMRGGLPGRAPALLALIARSGPAGLARDRACSLLWQDAPEARARQRLRQLLSDLRCLDAPVLARGTQLAIDAAALQVDTAEFEAMAHRGDVTALIGALALYRGPLAALLADASAEFDAWQMAERQRLERLALSACERLAACHHAANDDPRLVPVLERWLEIDPCAEPAHRSLMLAWMRLGRRADALAQYERCRDALRSTHGARPQAETEAMYRQLRAACTAGTRQRTIGEANVLSMAVLPLSTLKRDAVPLESLAQELTEDLSAALALRPGLAVVDAPMVRAAMARAQGDLLRASEILAVRYVVSGGLRVVVEGRVRLTLNLVSGADALYLWGVRAEFGLDEATADRLGAWAGDLELQACIAAVGMPQAVDEPAWENVRRANRTMFEKGWSEESVCATIDFYRQAVASDPAHALAFAQKSILIALAKHMGLVAGEEVHAEALADAEHALGLAPRNSEVLGYAACALADLGDPRRAEPYVQRAIAANPSNPQAWAAAGATHLALGRTQQGITMLERGLRLSPDDYRRPVWYSLLAGAYQRLGQPEQAVEMALTGCRADARYYPARLALAAIEIERGNDARAVAALREALRIRPRLTPTEARRWVRQRQMGRLLALWPGQPAH